MEEFKVIELNAFDIISFSLDLHLSSLFADSCNLSDNGLQLFMSTKSPEKIVEKIEDFAKVEKLKVKRKKDGVMELEGKSGNLVFGVKVYRLAEELVVVEDKNRGEDICCYQDMWKNKLSPQLNDLSLSMAMSPPPQPETSQIAGC